jgi:hypothetical protein
MGISLAHQDTFGNFLVDYNKALQFTSGGLAREVTLPAIPPVGDSGFSVTGNTALSQAVDGKGNPWFLMFSVSSGGDNAYIPVLGVRNGSGVQSIGTVFADDECITLGPDGNLWFWDFGPGPSFDDIFTKLDVQTGVITGTVADEVRFDTGTLITMPGSANEGELWLASSELIFGNYYAGIGKWSNLRSGVPIFSFRLASPLDPIFTARGSFNAPLCTSPDGQTFYSFGTRGPGRLGCLTQGPATTGPLTTPPEVFDVSGFIWPTGTWTEIVQQYLAVNQSNGEIWVLTWFLTNDPITGHFLSFNNIQWLEPNLDTINEWLLPSFTPAFLTGEYANGLCLDKNGYAWVSMDAMDSGGNCLMRVHPNRVGPLAYDLIPAPNYDFYPGSPPNNVPPGEYNTNNFTNPVIGPDGNVWVGQDYTHINHPNDTVDAEWVTMWSCNVDTFALTQKMTPIPNPYFSGPGTGLPANPPAFITNTSLITGASTVVPPTRQKPRDDNLALGAPRQRVGRGQPSSVQSSYRQGPRGSYS